MDRIRKHSLIIFVLAVVFFAGTALPVYADAPSQTEEAKEVYTEFPIGSVQLPNNSSVTFKDLALLNDNDGRVLVFTAAFDNRGDKDLSLLDYSIRVRNTTAAPFTVRVQSQDKDKQTVPVHSSSDLHCYVKVTDSTNLTDLVFEVIQWDAGADGYERSIGELNVPDNYSSITPVAAKRVLNVSGETLETSITQTKLNKTEKGLYPSITFHIVNTGRKSVALPLYRFFIRTSEGLLFPLKAAGLDEQHKTILPRFDKSLSLTAQLPLESPTEGMELVVAQTDEAAKLNLPVSVYLIGGDARQQEDPKALDSVEPVNLLDGTLEFAVNKVNRSKNDSSIQAAITVTLKNTGTQPLAVPNYRYFIQTADGFTYPASVNLKGLTLDPLVSKETVFNVKLSSQLKEDNWKLLIVEPGSADGAADGTAQDDNYGFPVAVITLQNAASSEAASGDAFSYHGKTGDYTLRIESIQRLPWEEQDIISAALTVKNSGHTPTAVPSFSGYFLLDDSIQVPFKAVVSDNVISIKGNAKLSFRLYGMMPYTDDYSKVKIVLQEKDGEETHDITEFVRDASLSAIPTVSSGNNNTILTVGKMTDVSVRSVRTYNGLESQLFTAQVAITNLERRPIAISNLTASFRTTDNQVFPAAISEIKNKIIPHGKALLQVSSTLPLNLNPDGIQLLLGDGVKGAKMAVAGEKPDAYIDAVAYILPNEDKQPKKDFTDLDLFPYTFSMNKISAFLVDESHFRFSFNYKLAKNLMVEANMEDRKLVLEFVDKYNEFTETLVLNKEGSLTLGEHKYEIDKTDSSIKSKLPYLDTYALNVYEEYLGQRKLLATKKINWLTTTE